MTPAAEPLTGDLSEVELLGQLGLGAGASDAQLEEAHDEIVAFLEEAPAPLRRWATSRIAEVDEAYAALSGEPFEQPSATVVPEAPLRDRVTRGAPETGGDLLAGGPTQDRGAEAPRRRRAGTRASSGQPSRPQRAPRPGTRLPGRLPALLIDPTVRKLGIAAAAIAALAIVGFAGYQLGNPGVPAINGSPNPSASAGGLDLAAVSADMQKIAANPKDVTALQDLADLYYASGDYQTAGTWIGKILAVDPANVSALLGKGAVAFNLGDLTTAEAAWRQVLVVDSKNLEAHYDLGFMYLKQDPPDTAKAKAEWQQVIDIAPDSDVAKTIQTHLQSLGAAASPSASPGASGVAAGPTPTSIASPSGSPSATRAPSPSTGGN